MKNLIKIILFVIVGTTCSFAIFFFMIFLEAKEFHERMSKVIHVSICLNEPIENLEGVTLAIRDEVNYYPIEVIKDTVGENVAISDECFPCSVSFQYDYVDGSHQIISADSFNCAGCSGCSLYELYRDSVVYSYRP